MVEGATRPARRRTPSPLSDAVEAARVKVRADLAAGQGGSELTATYSCAIAAALTTSLCGAWETRPRELSRTAVLMVGGLARDELCPFGDVDLVVLCERAYAEDERLADWMRGWLHPMWDAGLAPSATVQSPEGWLDAALVDLDLATALLDARIVVGDAELWAETSERARARYFGEARLVFLRRLAEDAKGRARKFGATPFRIEPDLKLGVGGTRDASTLGWAWLATHGTRDVDELVRDGALRRRSARVLTSAHDVVFRLRVGLHLAAGRAQDRLGFQQQEALAPLLTPGLLAPDGAIGDDALVQAIERFMQDYYQAASVLSRIGAREFSRCLPPREGPRVIERIDETFRRQDHALQHYGTDPFAERPALGLDAISLARDRRLRLAPHTLDCIAESVAAPAGERLADDADAQDRFLDLLVDPTFAGSPTPLEILHELGLLTRLVPEFAPLHGRMQHESFHSYTVDQHSIYLVEFLKALARGEYRKDHPLATALHLGLDDPRPLYMAALLHDVGKAHGDQVEAGPGFARMAAERSGLTLEQVERVAFLVREHLTMPLLSQKRDLSDALLIEEFAARVKDKRTLAELYLLSLADMAAVSPEYLSHWKGTLLDELYLLTAAQLARRRPRSSEGIARPDEPVGLPGRYYALFDQELRRHHKRLLDRFSAGARPVLLDLADGAGALRLTLIARDRRGLLATVAAAMAEFGLEVLAAEVFNVPGAPVHALDVFRVKALPPDGGAEADQVVVAPSPSTWLARLEEDIARRLTDAALERTLSEEPEPLPRPLRRGRRVATNTRVSFDEDSAGARTIVEIETADQPGVLRRITLAFAALNVPIELARLMTEGRRVLDVFYVPHLDELRRDQLAALIRRYLRRA